jgi:subtilisin-like proprotein convertase family protein
MMSISLRSKCLAVLALLIVCPTMTRMSSVSATQRPVANATSSRYALPLRFEPNRGQADPNVRFVSRGQSYTLLLTATDAVISTRPADVATDRQPLALRMMLAGGANRSPHITGEDTQLDTVNYVRGRDEKTWITDIPTYARVRYRDVYPGIDLVYYHHGSTLEYDFIVAPGADPDRIRLAFSGADSAVNADGDLVLRSAAGDLRQPKPVIYQDVDGQRRPIDGGFVLTADRQVRFDIGAYDRTRPLVIDPVLVWSTYFGGAGEETGLDVGVDANRNVYVVGTRPSARGGQDTDAFVAKYSPTGALLWVTNVGDTCDDEGRGIAVDAAGNVYVTGHLSGSCYPYPTLTNGGFVAKLTTAGAGRYIFPFSSDWSGADVGQAVAFDAAGNAYVGGVSSSMYFPTTAGVLQPQYSGWYGDGFVVKVNAAGTARVYATYLGGTGHDSLNDIAVDTNGNVYVVGSTSSKDFPTTAAAYQRVHNGLGVMATNAFISKLNPTGTALVYSTYLGGWLDDGATGLAIDAARNVFVTGTAMSDNFPTTAGVYQPRMAPQPVCDAARDLCTDAFVTKLNAAGSALIYSTYLGANLNDAANGIAIDNAGNTYITGSTYSTNFPIVNPLQRNPGSDMDAFVTKLNRAATALVYSSYLGGSKLSNLLSEGVDEGVRIAADADGANAYVTGITYSPNFPVTANAAQRVFGGGSCWYGTYRCADAFVMKIGDAPAPPPPAPVVRNYAYAGPAVAIPDNQPAGVRIPLAVANFPGTIGDLNVRFDGNVCTAAAGATTVGLTHPWVGDLTITLTSPANTTVTLANRPGGAGNAGDNLCQTVLDDEGGAASIQNVTAAGAPYRGTFRPATALTAFRGQNPNGTWFLTVSDGAAADVGALRAFTLSVTAR